MTGQGRFLTAQEFPQSHRVPVCGILMFGFPIAASGTASSVRLYGKNKNSASVSLTRQMSSRTAECVLGNTGVQVAIPWQRRQCCRVRSGEDRDTHLAGLKDGKRDPIGSIFMIRTTTFEYTCSAETQCWSL